MHSDTFSAPVTSSKKSIPAKSRTAHSTTTGTSWPATPATLNPGTLAHGLGVLKTTRRVHGRTFHCASHKPLRQESSAVPSCDEEDKKFATVSTLQSGNLCLAGAEPGHAAAYCSASFSRFVGHGSSVELVCLAAINF